MTNRSDKNDSVFAATIDLDEDGKHFGQIQIPHSRDEAGLGNLLVPIVSIRNGTGPCALLLAGNHGDEFEGQISLRNIVHEIEPEHIKGQTIVVPSMNLPAVLNNSRCSPLDGKNMNRIFPGDPRGSITEKIASYVYSQLVQRSDVVVDLHAGGRNLFCLSFAMMHRYPDVVISRTTLDLMKAFAVPYGVVFETEPDRLGMLDTAVEDLGKPFIAVELGGSGTVTPDSVAVTTRGVRNVLIHCGVLAEDPDPGETPMKIMSVPPSGFVYAEDHGIFEPFVEVGQDVEAGQAIGQMHSIHRPDRQPIVHRVQAGGLVLIRRTTGLATHGDGILVVAVPQDPGF